MHLITDTEPRSVAHYTTSIESSCIKTQNEVEIAVQRVMTAVLSFLHSRPLCPKLGSVALYLVTFHFNQVSSFRCPGPLITNGKIEYLGLFMLRLR
jgi:hypothetical protein